MPPSGHHQATGSRLIGAAKNCETQLTRLRQQAREAQQSRARRTEATKRVLDDIIKRTNISIASLEAWTLTVSKGEQTSDESALETVVGHFDPLEKHIAAARKALETRLRTRAFYLCIPASGKKAGTNERIDKALTKIDQTIGSLQNQTKTVVVDSRRRSQIGEISSSRSKYYEVFKKDFSRMSSMERHTTRFGVLPCLWNEFPPRPGWDDHIGSAENPGDGLVYGEKQINLVASILKALYEAWSNTTVQSSPARSSSSPKVAKLTEMAKICLVLYGMKQQRLLDHFREHGIVDKDLPLNLSTIKGVLPDEDSYHATVFSTEQYRAVPRQWDDGAHITIPQEEPLPLEKVNDYGSGSYSTVIGCKCKFTQRSYARKEQVSREAREHLKREVDRLKRLEHRHIVQFAKSYERGDTFGILLQPAATTDLKKLLRRYAKNNYDYGANGESRVRERTLFKPIILTSFGCLSRGLAHIHSRNIRHKDIKPENILYQKELVPEQARFLWADFGRAHYFAQGEGSKTSTNMQLYSEKYAAPESLEANLLSAHVRRANQDHTRLGIESLEMEGSHEGSSDISKTDTPALIGRGRSSDIFSFGCVFLETLSHLVDEQRGELDRKEFESYAPFHKHIDQLKTWAVEEMKHLEPQSSLTLLFQIGLGMIAREPEDRPKIHKIVKQLQDANPEYFCRKCQHGAEEDRRLREKEVVHEHHSLRDQPSVSDSIKESQADPETRRILLADLVLSVPPQQSPLGPNEAIPEPAESSSVAHWHSPAQLRRSALKQADPANPEKKKNTPHFEDLNMDDEDL